MATDQLKYGFVFPGQDVKQALECAELAEAHGWDGFFVWDSVWALDPWAQLAAIAVRTKRIRLGTMITPVSRQRPWTLAGQTVTVDHLSDGRLILPVGLGALDTGFANFGEQTDRKIRAELLDEGLEIITGLWKGQPFNYKGKHYQIKELSFMSPPPPVQQPRIPIWVVGAWPREKSMGRVVKYDGILPNKLDEQGKHGAYNADDLRAIKTYVTEHRKLDTPFDIVCEGTTPKDQKNLEAFADAGMTWWIESMWEAPNGLADLKARLKDGPPKIG